jgi:Leucine-rich repeat (LRR) protein
MSDNANSLPAADPVVLANAQTWWNGLTAEWKRAFNEAALQRKDSTDILPDDLLCVVFTSPNHRFAGPTASYPNMSFELTDMSGLVGLPNAEVVVVTFHQLRHLEEVAHMPKLKSLFVNNNQITSLKGIENHVQLIDLYVQNNLLTSIEQVEKLVNLRALYCANNLISDLKGVGRQHLDNLGQLFCMPNPNLKKSTIFDFEEATRIKTNKL